MLRSALRRAMRWPVDHNRLLSAYLPRGLMHLSTSYRILSKSVVRYGMYNVLHAQVYYFVSSCSELLWSASIANKQLILNVEIIDNRSTCFTTLNREQCVTCNNSSVAWQSNINFHRIFVGWRRAEWEVDRRLWIRVYWRWSRRQVCT